MDFDPEGSAGQIFYRHSLSGLISIRPEMHSTQKISDLEKIRVCVYVCTHLYLLLCLSRRNSKFWLKQKCKNKRVMILVAAVKSFKSKTAPLF